MLEAIFRCAWEGNTEASEPETRKQAALQSPAHRQQGARARAGAGAARELDRLALPAPAPPRASAPTLLRG